MDILVAIVGGRYGSPSSKNPPHSISQVELKTAHELGKPIYIFIDRNVSNEYKTFLLNKDNEGVQYSSVDDVRVFTFIKEIKELPVNNPITSFETTADIIGYLREQWAGLFRRLLQEQARQEEVKILQDMKATSRTLNELVAFLTEDRKQGDHAIRDILMTNHPVFGQVGTLLQIPYRVFFTNKQEFTSWLKARSYEAVDEIFSEYPEFEEWTLTYRDTKYTLYVSQKIFDDEGKLRVFTKDEWNEDWIRLAEKEIPKKEDDDDDIPF